MRSLEVSGGDKQTTECMAKRTGSRKRKRGEGVPVTSRYFQGASSNNAFRFVTTVSPDANDRSKHSIGHNRGQKIALVEKLVENENHDQTLGYVLFAENKSDNLVYRNGSTSDYFLRSPSSAYGSVLSLGPLVCTWIDSGSRDEIRSKCSRQISSSSSGKPCDECSILLQDAFQHFRNCSVFRQKLNTFHMNFGHMEENNPQATCVEVVGQWAERHALRHLCTNQCFLRAFAPSRDWLSLRKHLKTIAPIGGTLDHWTCRLVHETKDEGKAVLCNRAPLTCPSHCDGFKIVKGHRKARQGNLPRTVFVSLNTGKSFVSIQKGHKHIFEENIDEKAMKNQIMIGNECESSRFDKSFYKDTMAKVESPFGLIEELFPNEPWRILICTMLLNKTQRKQNLDSILYHLFLRWPTADSVVKDADLDEEEVHLFVFALVRRAGQGQRKARALVQLSRDYLHILESKSQSNEKNQISTRKGVEFELTRADVKQLFNCGDYAADAYQIFIRKDFDTPILSNDQMLLAYVEWKRSLSCIG